MKKGLRYFLFLVGTGQIFFTVAFFLQWPLATGAWPFPGTTPLTFDLVASILAAAAASTLWVAASENYAALAGIGLDYVAVMLPLAIFSFVLAANGGAGMRSFGIKAVILTLFGLGLFLWGMRFPLDRSQAAPRLARGSFGVFIGVLLLASAALIARTPNVIPWKITPDLSVVIGLIFLGAAAYFAYALLRPAWVNCVGQLLGFLAYDAVLIVPLLGRAGSIPPEQRTGLIIYVAVVVYSAFLAVYYLLVYRPKRAFLKAG
jgi:hypothetical protein